MQKGLVFDIRRYSVHDGPGIRTTVFLKGCPLHCSWCHNPEGLMNEPQTIRRTRQLNGKKTIHYENVGEWRTSREVFELIMKDIIFYEESGGGVTFSGGEPLMQPDFLLEMLSLCRQAGIHTAVDTSGHAPGEVFNLIAQNTDLLLYDLKTTDNGKHLTYTGVSKELSLINLKSITDDSARLIIRIPVIPGFNCDIKQFKAMRDQLLELKVQIQRVDLLPCHQLGRQKYRDLGLKTPVKFNTDIDEEQINMLMNIFAGSGFNVKKGG